MNNYLRDLRTQRLTAKRAPKTKALPAAAKPEPLADLDWRLLQAALRVPQRLRTLTRLATAGYAVRRESGLLPGASWYLTQAGKDRLREIVEGMGT